MKKTLRTYKITVREGVTIVILSFFVVLACIGFFTIGFGQVELIEGFWSFGSGGNFVVVPPASEPPTQDGGNGVPDGRALFYEWSNSNKITRITDKLLCDGGDFAYGYTAVRYNDNWYALSLTGTKYLLQDPYHREMEPRHIVIKHGYYIFGNYGAVGLRHIRYGAVIEPQFDSILLGYGFVLAITGDTLYTIGYDGTVIASRDRYGLGTIAVEGRLIVANSTKDHSVVVFDSGFTQAYSLGYRIVAVFGGMHIVVSERGYYGLTNDYRVVLSIDRQFVFPLSDRFVMVDDDWQIILLDLITNDIIRPIGVPIAIISDRFVLSRYVDGIVSRYRLSDMLDEIPVESVAVGYTTRGTIFGSRLFLYHAADNVVESEFDLDGYIIEPTSITRIRPVSDAMAIVCYGYGWQMINAYGQQLTDLACDITYNNGVIRVRIGYHIGYFAVA